MSAQIFEKIFPLRADLAKSKPPKKHINPKDTTICIKSFFLFSNLIDRYEKNMIGKPINEGM